MVHTWTKFFSTFKNISTFLSIREGFCRSNRRLGRGDRKQPFGFQFRGNLSYQELLLVHFCNPTNQHTKTQIPRYSWFKESKRNIPQINSHVASYVSCVSFLKSKNLETHFACIPQTHLIFKFHLPEEKKEKGKKNCTWLVLLSVLNKIRKTDLPFVIATSKFSFTFTKSVSHQSEKWTVFKLSST